MAPGPPGAYLGDPFAPTPDPRAVSPTEYQELIHFLARRFDAIDRRFDALETGVDALKGQVGEMDTRLTRVEVELESLRQDLRVVAEAVIHNGTRIERNATLILENRRHIEGNGLRITRLETLLDVA